MENKIESRKTKDEKRKTKDGLTLWLAKDADGRMFIHSEKPAWRNVPGFGECFVADNGHSVYVGKLLDQRIIKKGECKEIEVKVKS